MERALTAEVEATVQVSNQLVIFARFDELPWNVKQRVLSKLSFEDCSKAFLVSQDFKQIFADTIQGL